MRGRVCNLLLQLVLASAVPWDSRPYFIVPMFETPPTCRTMSPYLYPPGTGWTRYTPGYWVPFPPPLTTLRVKVKVMLRLTVSRPVRLGVSQPYGTHDQFFPFSLLSFLDGCGFVCVGRPLGREDGSVICSAMIQVQCQVILWPTVCRSVRLGAGTQWGSWPDFNFCVWQLLRLLGVGLPHPYPPWTGWYSQKSKPR
jgi:hypothetical protein